MQTYSTVFRLYLCDKNVILSIFYVTFTTIFALARCRAGRGRTWPGLALHFIDSVRCVVFAFSGFLSLKVFRGGPLSCSINTGFQFRFINHFFLQACHGQHQAGKRSAAADGLRRQKDVGCGLTS